ncbi:hypothetical protein XACJK48_2370011 [Xanthomonas citri pv. citri]|nr:hypothetical protein XACLE3_2220010 [Xanthomonas citri pv. citri]CEH37983.1 hypothetical protein XACJK48_2370011 [Xanthomonas citri pv. citri]CEH44759.1 hypothetical protein XACG102_2540006 [Xanthomonas citri pv. citri]CEH92105.1 hypothetical protein XACB302_2790007 [Xanthomonas citri pv. citri]CEI07843.1 hypothetical protein XACS581_620011 [Xanthomonas citri pv. citri]
MTTRCAKTTTCTQPRVTSSPIRSGPGWSPTSAIMRSGMRSGSELRAASRATACPPFAALLAGGFVWSVGSGCLSWIGRWCFGRSAGLPRFATLPRRSAPGRDGFTGNACRAQVRSYDLIGIVATVIFQARGLGTLVAGSARSTAQTTASRNLTRPPIRRRQG